MKTFLVINLSYFGDVLLTNALCQSIKKEYPDSKVVFLVNAPFYEAAKYQKDVDDVLCFDKRDAHKGLLGLLRFIFNCKYRNKIDVAFIMYANDRGVLISFGLGSKERISGSPRISNIFLTQKKVEVAEFVHTQDHNAAFLSAVTNKFPAPIAIKFEPPQEALDYAESILTPYKDKKIIGLCLTSKKSEKDMPLSEAVILINRLVNEGNTVVFTGSGDIAQKYSQGLKDAGCDSFIDLTNKTSIAELGAIIQRCDNFISVDTGSMHLACAVGTPLLSLFYSYDLHHLDKWQPKEDLYNCKALLSDITTDNILSALETFPSKVMQLN